MTLFKYLPTLGIFLNIMDGMNVPRIHYLGTSKRGLFARRWKYGALVASLSLSTMKMSKSQDKFVIHDLLLVDHITSHY